MSFGESYPLEDVPKTEIGYKTAGGGRVLDQGRRKVQLKVTGGKHRVWKPRIGDVHKPLLAISELNDAGHDVHFTALHGAWAENTKTGEVTWFTRNNGIFEFEAEIVPYSERRMVTPKKQHRSWNSWGCWNNWSSSNQWQAW